MALTTAWSVARTPDTAFRIFSLWQLPDSARPLIAAMSSEVMTLNEGTSPETGLHLLMEDDTSLSPEQLGERLQREPPERLELPDGVALTGTSLTAFLESAHFPYGRYRVGGAAYFV